MAFHMLLNPVCSLQDQVTAIKSMPHSSPQHIPRKMSLFCSSLGSTKRLVVTIVIQTLFFIGSLTVKFGFKHYLHSTPSNEYK